MAPLQPLLFAVHACIAQRCCSSRQWPGATLCCAGRDAGLAAPRSRQAHLLQRRCLRRAVAVRLLAPLIHCLSLPMPSCCLIRCNGLSRKQNIIPHSAHAAPAAPAAACRYDKRDGRGKMTFVRGLQYDGEWKDDKAHG